MGEEPLACHGTAPALPAYEPGATATCFDLAGSTLQLSSDDPLLCRWIERRFQPFATTARPRWTVSCHVTAPTPPFLGSPLEQYSESTTVQPLPDGRFRLSGATFAAEVDPRSRSCLLRGPLATFPVDSLLRHLLPLVVDDGLVLHGALLCQDGRAWVCSGPSGSGKSTLAGLLPEQAYCDELVAVQRRDGCWQARALPFWRARPGGGRLEEILLLQHGSAHRQSALTPAQAGRALVSQVLWPIACTDSLERSFNRLLALVAEIGCQRLELTPDPSVWQVISGGRCVG